MYVCMNCGKMANLIVQIKLDKEAKIDLCPCCAKDVMDRKKKADSKPEFKKIKK